MLLVTVVIGAKAEEAVIYHQGTNANSITVNGFTLAITSNSKKTWQAGGGDMTVNGTNRKSLKNSNGAKNTLTAPAGKVITGVTFYVTTAKNEGPGMLSEFEGEPCSDVVSTSQQYGTSCDVIEKTLAKPANTVTFTFSSKQVNFVALVTFEDAAADYVATPDISVSGATVTLTCATDGAKLYYTTDGTVPTAESTEYSSPIKMTESATVRAIAVKGENVSNEVVKDVYVAGVGYIAKLGFASGTLNDAQNVWTSNDGMFTLTNNTRTISNTSIAGSQDGFKLNHTDDYVLQPAADVKVTKIVVVGKTWLQGNAGNASTISIEGFTPESGSFIDYLTGGTSYVKTITFTADGTVDYGTAIPMHIGNNQLGAYLEVYGEVYQTATTYDNGWVSFTPSVDCAVTTENAAAYVATSVDGNNVTMTKVNDMKAGNGYFLYAGASEAKTLVVKGVQEATAPVENLLKGCTTDTEIDGSANSIYCLGKLSDTAGLYKVSTTLTVPAGKAYLQAPGVVKVKALNLVFSDSSEATAVKSINAQVEKNEAAVGTKHLLNGQIVIKTQNGFVNLMGVKVK